MRLAAAEGDEVREYDFNLSKGVLLYSQERYGEAERYLREAPSLPSRDLLQ